MIDNRCAVLVLPIAMVVAVGLNPTLVFSELYWETQHLKSNEIDFKVSYISRATRLTNKQVKSAMEVLEELGFVKYGEDERKKMCIVNTEKYLELIDIKRTSVKNPYSGSICQFETMKKRQDLIDSVKAEKTQKKTRIKTYYTIAAQTLYENGQIADCKPVVNNAVINARLDFLLDIVSEEDIYKVIDMCAKDAWVVSRGFLLQIILSEGVFKTRLAQLKQPKKEFFKDEVKRDYENSIDF